MLRVALTGGAASGKSAVAAALERMGAFVSRSDEVGRAMMQPGEAVFNAIAAHFGAGVVRPDGTLDRRELARLAFAEGRVEELNLIVHPAVIAAQGRWLEEIGREHPGGVAVVESALVLETVHGASSGLPWRSRFDYVVLVTAPEAVRLERYVRRVLASDGEGNATTARANALRLFALQMPEEEKRRLADVVVDNDGAMDELLRRTEELYEQLQAEEERRAGA